MIAVGRCLAVWSRLRRRFGGVKRFTAAGRGDRSRRRELPLVVVRLRRFNPAVGGVIASIRSSSDFSLGSLTNVGV